MRKGGVELAGVLDQRLLLGECSQLGRARFERSGQRLESVFLCHLANHLEVRVIFEFVFGREQVLEQVDHGVDASFVGLFIIAERKHFFNGKLQNPGFNGLMIMFGIS